VPLDMIHWRSINRMPAVPPLKYRLIHAHTPHRLLGATVPLVHPSESWRSGYQTHSKLFPPQSTSLRYTLCGPVPDGSLPSGFPLPRPPPPNVAALRRGSVTRVANEYYFVERSHLLS
jgi:hypothetical protein